MGETDTTLLQRSKTLAQKPAVKRTALGGGTAAIMLSIYQIFLTKAEFSDYKAEAENRAVQKASVLWQELKTLENTLDGVRMDIVRLQTLKTNTP